jgi:hypothetical protein
MASTCKLHNVAESAFDVLAGAAVSNVKIKCESHAIERSWSEHLTDNEAAASHHIAQKAFSHPLPCLGTPLEDCVQGHGPGLFSSLESATGAPQMQDAQVEHAQTASTAVHSNLHAALSLKKAMEHLTLAEALREETSSSTGGPDR